MKIFNQLVSYFKGVISELKKVVWPTFPVLVKYFVGVVVGVAIATVFVGLVDYAFIHLLTLFLNK
jgi:preprotein translocase subunit SecE